jgi:hypothetical protein
LFAKTNCLISLSIKSAIITCRKKILTVQQIRGVAVDSPYAQECRMAAARAKHYVMVRIRVLNRLNTIEKLSEYDLLGKIISAGEGCLQINVCAQDTA